MTIIYKGLKKLLKQENNVHEEISEKLETTEDLLPTQNNLIEDWDEKLVSETKKLETELKHAANNQGSNALEGLLNFDSILTLEEPSAKE